MAGLFHRHRILELDVAPTGISIVVSIQRTIPASSGLAASDPSSRWNRLIRTFMTDQAHAVSDEVGAAAVRLRASSASPAPITSPPGARARTLAKAASAAPPQSRPRRSSTSASSLPPRPVVGDVATLTSQVTSRLNRHHLARRPGLVRAGSAVGRTQASGGSRSNCRAPVPSPPAADPCDDLALGRALARAPRWCRLHSRADPLCRARSRSSSTRRPLTTRRSSSTPTASERLGRACRRPAEQRGRSCPSAGRPPRRRTAARAGALALRCRISKVHGNPRCPGPSKKSAASAEGMVGVVGRLFIG